MKNYYIYILASRKKGSLYVGITSDLLKRVYEHKKEYIDGFSKRYNTKKLVYYEVSSDPNSAIKREKILKKWKRQWKINLIEEKNPEWKDLSNGWYD